MVHRETLPDGSTRLSAGTCAFVYWRRGPRVLFVTISGKDAGQFGTATLDEISLAIQRERPLELFLDARHALDPAIGVSDDWRHFFATNRASLSRVHVLVGSRAVYLTIAIAQHLSRTGSLIQIYSDSEIFERLLTAREHVGN